LQTWLKRNKKKEGCMIVKDIKDLGRIHFGVLDTMHATALSFYNDLGFKPFGI
jgi:hypothetical protein